LTCAATRRRLDAFRDRELPVAEEIAVSAHAQHKPGGMNSAPTPDSSSTRGIWLRAGILFAIVVAGAFTGPWWHPLTNPDGLLPSRVRRAALRSR
jgi:hypothetical protein